MSSLLILTVILLYTLQSFFCKKYTSHYPGYDADAPDVFTIVSGVIITVISLAVSCFSFTPKPLTVLLGLFNAVTLFAYNYAIVKGSQTGPYSILITFSLAGGIIIPAVISAVCWGSSLSLWQIVSMLVIFAAVYLSSYKKEETDKKPSPIFIFFCFVLGISNGIYGALLDSQQRLTGSADKEEMVAVTFISAALLSLLVMLIKKPNHIISALKQTKRSAFYLIACSLIAALAINALVYVLPLINVTVFYTVENAGVLLLSIICSRLFLKERLSVTNVVGCALMCLGLIGISVL